MGDDVPRMNHNKGMSSFVNLLGETNCSYLEEDSSLLGNPNCFAEAQIGYVNSHSSSFLDAHTCIDLFSLSDADADMYMFH